MNGACLASADHLCPKSPIAVRDYMILIIVLYIINEFFARTSDKRTRVNNHHHLFLLAENNIIYCRLNLAIHTAVSWL